MCHGVGRYVLNPPGFGNPFFVSICSTMRLLHTGFALSGIVVTLI